MREGFGRNSYRLAKAARIIALLLAFYAVGFSCVSRCRAAALPVHEGGPSFTAYYDNGTFGNGTAGNDTAGNGTYGNGTINGTTGNGTISQEDPVGKTDSSGKAGDASVTKAAEEPQQEKPKKQLAAENFALGVLLAGGIAIGMMIAVFFYYAKNNNSSQD